MTKTIFDFEVSSEEDLRFQLDFVGLDLSGRTLKVNVRERATNALKVSLSAPTNLTLVGEGNLTVFYPRASMETWAKGIEYEADVLDESSGSATRIMAVRFAYDDPGKLVYGVKGSQATVKWGANKAVVTAIGGVGPPGPANVLTIGEVETLETGEDATAEITGSAPTQVLSLGLPKGNTGNQGPAGEIVAVTIETLAAGADATVENEGTSEQAELHFGIPSGDQGEKGWSPELAVVIDGGRRVHQVVDWVGGEGTKPQAGDYVGEGGLVSNIADAVNVRGDQGPPGSVADGDKGDIVVSDGGTAWALRDSAALSVIGRSANSSGDPADIAAGTDGHVLRRSGTTLGFGTTATAGIADDAVTNTKLANMAANTIKGSVAGGDPADLTGADVRAIAGQKWVTVYDSGLISTAVANVDISLATYSQFRISVTIVPNTAVASFLINWRLSFNNGASYDAGASDYTREAFTQTGTTLSGSASATSNSGFFSGTIDTASTAVSGRVTATLFKGASGTVPKLEAYSTTFNGTAYALQIFNGNRGSANAATNLRLLTSTGTAGVGVGSRIIVEGC